MYGLGSFDFPALTAREGRQGGVSPMFKLLRSLTWLTQLGLSIMAPPVLCIGACWWLQSRFGLGVWIMVLGIVLGLGGSVSGALQFYRMVRRQAEKGKKDTPDAFNTHE